MLTEPVVTLATPEGKAKVPVSSMPQDHSVQGSGQQVTAFVSRVSPGHRPGHSNRDSVWPEARQYHAFFFGKSRIPTDEMGTLAKH